MELLKEESFCENYNPNAVYEKSLCILKAEVAKQCLKKQNRKVYSDIKTISNNFEQFVSDYPVVMSTTFSSRNCMPYKDTNFLYDYVIMDEASQIDIVTGALALSCAENAVIVGDKKQLPNVVPENLQKSANEVFNKYPLSKGYEFTNSFLSSLEAIFPEIPQTLLREHYRCHPKIINFCNQRFYDGKLLIMTEENTNKALAAFRTVPGNHCSNKYNQRQIDIIRDEILPNIDTSNKDEIGIIAPYNNQINAIKSQLPEYECATVHSFQGKEKDIIIISTVDNEISDFTDNDNILNVAISRAKKQLFIIVSGNEQKQDTNIMELIHYIEYNNLEEIGRAHV